MNYSDYNTTRSPITLRSYGRNMQVIIEKIKTKADRGQRTQLAKAAIKSMTLLVANPKGELNNTQKRWHELFAIAHHTLDVDSPVPIPEKLQSQPPRPLPYPQSPIKMRAYGRHMTQVLQEVKNQVKSEKREQVIIGIVKAVKNMHGIHGDHANPEAILSTIQSMLGTAFTFDIDTVRTKLKSRMPHETRSKRSTKSSTSARNYKNQ